MNINDITAFDTDLSESERHAQSVKIMCQEKAQQVQTMIALGNVYIERLRELNDAATNFITALNDCKSTGPKPENE